MGLDEKHYVYAHQMLERRRMDNLNVEVQRRQQIYREIPDYATLEAALSSTAVRLIPLLLDPSEEARQGIVALRHENLDIQNKMSELLKNHGYEKSFLEPLYSCSVCKDQGTVDGQWCDCFKRLVYNSAAQELNERSPLKLCDFDSFRLDLYPETVEPQLSATQRSIMTKNYEICKTFAETFDKNGEGLLMLGGTGLGKTHLSLAIANRSIQRGFSTLYCSVPELLRTLEREQFGKESGDTMALLMSCDLLILDDLGAELSNERNISMIYEIINVRMNRSLSMVVSTNLSAKQIQQRYSDRIWSRLFSLRGLIFCGTDNRLKLARKT